MTQVRGLGNDKWEAGSTLKDANMRTELFEQPEYLGPD